MTKGPKHPGLGPKDSWRVTIYLLRTGDFSEPVRRSEGTGTKTGLSTSLYLNQFMHLLFFVNETLPYAKKMTDAEIVRQLGQEFPNSRIVKALQGKDKRRPYSRVGFWRCEYNAGRLPKGLMPQLISHRWDVGGNMLNFRGRPYTEQELERVSLEDETLQDKLNLPAADFDRDGSLKPNPFIKVQVGNNDTVWPYQMTGAAHAKAVRIARGLKRSNREKKKVHDRIKKIKGKSVRKRVKEAIDSEQPPRPQT